MFGPKRTWSSPLGFPISDGKNPEFSHGFSGQQSPAQGAGDGLGDRRHGGGGGDAWFQLHFGRDHDWLDYIYTHIYMYDYIIMYIKTSIKNHV